MNKKYIFSAIGIVFLAVLFWFLYQWQLNKKSAVPDMITIVETFAKAQSNASNAIEKTNPFGADINPMQGYKNPFE
ncbi:MAG: hypothetical protein NTZ13_04685 [Candidatus Parcubacteria bacterium]|nr:hypothetical protein [Candidatus Parcubacteria bacterium]